MESKIKRNMLSRKDEFRLADWVRAKAAQLPEMTCEEAAQSAGRELGITLGCVNLRNVATDLGYTIKFKRDPSRRSPPGEGAKARLARLEHLVAHLYAKLGETLPG